jgi:hypothetical protein
MDVSCNKEYMDGKMNKEEVIDEFIGNFDSQIIKNGTLSLAEFVGYYEDLSICIPSEDYFVNIIE